MSKAPVLHRETEANGKSETSFLVFHRLFIWEDFFKQEFGPSGIIFEI